jgi:hypothetical protein
VSKSELRTFDCPQCGNTIEKRAWESVNVTIDPHMRAEVLTGEIFDFACSSCGHSDSVRYNLLYNDMEREFMVWLIYPDSPDSSRKGLSLASMIPGQFRMRTVENVNSLLEKIVVLEEGLDDVSVEVMKLELRRQESPNLEGADLMFIGQDQDEEEGVFLIKARMPDGETTAFTLTADAIRYVHQQIEASNVSGCHVPLGEWHQINEAYAHPIWMRALPAGG